LGADDYIQKPFSISELRARVGAHLRREKRLPVHHIRSGDFSLDIKTKELYYQNNLVALNKTIFEKSY